MVITGRIFLLLNKSQLNLFLEEAFTVIMRTSSVSSTHLDVCAVVLGQQCMRHNANANNILFIMMSRYTIYVILG